MYPAGHAGAAQAKGLRDCLRGGPVVPAAQPVQDPPQRPLVRFPRLLQPSGSSPGALLPPPAGPAPGAPGPAPCGPVGRLTPAAGPTAPGPAPRPPRIPRPASSSTSRWSTSSTARSPRGIKAWIKATPRPGPPTPSPPAARPPPVPCRCAQPAVPYAREQPPSVVVWVFTPNSIPHRERCSLVFQLALGHPLGDDIVKLEWDHDIEEGWVLLGTEDVCLARTTAGPAASQGEFYSPGRVDIREVGHDI